MASSSSNSSFGKLDFSGFLGFAIALGGIAGGMVMEGGNLADIAQTTAALIVMGGTFGAVLITTPTSILFSSLRRLGRIFREQKNSAAEVVEEVIVYAAKARKSGLVALEEDVPKIGDPFFRKSLALAVDGTDLKSLRSMMEMQMRLEQSEAERDARVFESAGGYAPTIGILGAVIGLIQVMKHLDDIAHVGTGIAIAFVATLYGVALANLLFLPLGQRVRLQAQQTNRSRQLVLEGVVTIVEGTNPRFIRRRLEAFTQHRKGSKGAPQELAAAVSE